VKILVWFGDFVGTVNLLAHAGADDLRPGLEGLRARSAVVRGRNAVATEMEEVGDQIANGQEALNLPG
jgi:hypothetical protein